MIGITSVLFFVAVVLSTVLISGVALGVIKKKPVLLTVNSVILDRIKTTLRNSVSTPYGDYTLLKDTPISNPTYTWGRYFVNSEHGVDNVPYPHLHWSRVRTADRGVQLEEVIKKEFVAKFKTQFDSWCFFAPAVYADYFLDEIEREFGNEGVKICRYRSVGQNLEGRELVYFDVSYNTGSTLKDVLLNTQSKELPTKYVFLVFNDIIDPQSQYRPWRSKDSIIYLYGLSDTFEFWTNNPNVPTAIRLIQAASYGVLSWTEPTVRKALLVLRKVLN